MAKFWSERKTIVASDFQEDALFTLMEETDSNILITGAAGTGKSTLLNNFIDKTKKNCVVLAPTGIAATNVRGQTIHSFFLLPPGIPTKEEINKERFKPLYESINTLVIDEISMVRKDAFEAMDLILRKNKEANKPFGGVQLIMFGDMYQLPPVVGDNEKIVLDRKYPGNSYYFFDSESYKDLDLWVIHLNHVYRQSDPIFIEILNRMQKNKLTSEDLEILNKKIEVNTDGEDHVILSTRNNVVEEYNQNKLKLLLGPLFSYDATIKKSAEYGTVRIENTPAAGTLNLKVDARVMFLINDKNKQFCNGSLGTVTDLTDKHVNVKLDSNKRTIRVGKHDWEVIKYSYKSKELQREILGTVSQIPLKLAWAITIHKSQGQTLDKVMIDLKYHPWESGHSYVAFSRVRSLEGLKLKTCLRKEDIIVDPVIINWERKLKEEKTSINESYEMGVSGLEYEELKEIVDSVNKELEDLGISDMVSFKNSILIKKNLFFSFIKSRIIFLLGKVKDEKRKNIIIDEGKKNEIILSFKPSVAEWYTNLRKGLDKKN